MLKKGGESEKDSARERVMQTQKSTRYPNTNPTYPLKSPVSPQKKHIHEKNRTVTNFYESELRMRLVWGLRKSGNANQPVNL